VNGLSTCIGAYIALNPHHPPLSAAHLPLKYSYYISPPSPFFCSLSPTPHILLNHKPHTNLDYYNYNMTDTNSMSSKSSDNTTLSADQKGEIRWDFRFSGDDSPRSSLAPSSPPSSVEKKKKKKKKTKKHSVLCRLKTAIKKTFGRPKGNEFKDDPRVTVCCLC
jgi:hypothetical protein